MNPIDMQKNQTSKATKAVTVIGMSDDGCVSLTSKAVHAVSKAQVLVGGERHLEFFPQFEGLKIPFKDKLPEVIKRVDKLSCENTIVVLASGDPLFYGIGELLVKKLGLKKVDIIAHPGSIQLAFSRIGLNWQDALTISLHGRSIKGFITKIKTSSKVAVLTDQEKSPKEIARYMLSYQESGWKAWVCENLGSVDERVRQFTIEKLSQNRDTGKLNVLILIRKEELNEESPVIPFLREDEFNKRMPRKGLITKREIRLLALGNLGLHKKSIVWDVGTASGSVAIEAAKIAYEGFVYAVEVSADCVEIAKANAIKHKVDNIDIIKGRAPQALNNLPSPDAVFVGGSKGSLKKILDVSLKKLLNHGHIVITAVTIETVQEAYRYFKDKNLEAEIIVVNISRVVPLIQYHRYEALSPVHIFTVRKKEGK